jgi:hypothetical protein
MLLTHDLGRSIALVDPASGLDRWTYVYSGKPKPYFHPVRTPAGHCLTNVEPHDHLWHRGLWYTIKFVNGENFWEERPPFGTQYTLAPPSVAHGPRGRIIVDTALDWRRAGGGVVICEQRRFAYEPLGDDAYALDFATNLQAQVDLLLDRTPYTTWGGYGGLILRGTRNWQETRLLFADGAVIDRPLGHRANWCDLSGKLDGGLDQTGGLAIFDHPDNLRHPSPWYGANDSRNYFNAAFLFHEPMTVISGDTLRFQYRVLVHDGIWDHARLDAAYAAYVDEAAPAPQFWGEHAGANAVASDNSTGGADGPHPSPSTGGR